MQLADRFVMAALVSVLGACGDADPNSNSPDDTPTTSKAKKTDASAPSGRGRDGGAADDNGDPTGDPPGDSGGIPPNPDGGPIPVGGPYPAFQPDVAQLVNNGGPVYATPTVVTVTWSGDDQAASFEQLADSLVGSTYWHAVTGEYGVTGIKSSAASHVRMNDSLPSFWSEQAMYSYISAKITSGIWPSPAQAIYLLYPPDTTTIDDGNGGDACDTYEGFHDEVAAGSRHVAYGVVMRCNGELIDEVTTIATHEIAEATLDPLYTSGSGWINVDPDHVAYTIMLNQQNENGDLCEYNDPYVVPPTAAIPFATQLLWSNQSVAAGHDPCVPASPGPYFNVTPMGGLSDLTIDMSQLSGSATTHTKGLPLRVGQSGTVQVGFYSDAPMEAWSLDAIEMDPAGNPFERTNSPTVTLSLDRTSGKNGDTATLTVHRTGNSSLGAALVLFVSTANGRKHYMPILVGGK